MLLTGGVDGAVVLLVTSDGLHQDGVWEETEHCTVRSQADTVVHYGLKQSKTFWKNGWMFPDDSYIPQIYT